MRIEKIIDHFGNQSRLAEALGVDRAAVCLWRRYGLPPSRAIQIEQVTGGAFKATEIVGARGEGDENDGDN